MLTASRRSVRPGDLTDVRRAFALETMMRRRNPRTGRTVAFEGGKPVASRPAEHMIILSYRTSTIRHDPDGVCLVVHTLERPKCSRRSSAHECRHESAAGHFIPTRSLFVAKRLDCQHGATAASLWQLSTCAPAHSPRRRASCRFATSTRARYEIVTTMRNMRWDRNTDADSRRVAPEKSVGVTPREARRWMSRRGLEMHGGFLG
jgi:hypothetical protein